MKKIVKLPINPVPILTSFSYYAFLDSIISAQERIGEVFARFQIVESSYSDWNMGGNVKKINEDCYCGQTEDIYRRDCNGYVIRKMHVSDYLNVRIEYQQYTNSWAAVNVFVTDDLENVLLGDEQYKYRFGHFANIGTALYASSKKIDIPSERYKQPYSLIIKREGTTLQFFSGTEKSLKMAECQMISSSKEVYVGIQIKHGENSYYPWLFSNFIQLGCDVYNPDRRLDHVFGITKYWENGDISFFLDKNQYAKDEIIYLGGIKYLIYCLKQEKYIETKVDQYYFKEREEFLNFHHYHQVLIYGVDEKRKRFFLLGYDKKGKVQTMQISFGDLQESIRQGNNILYKVIQYEQGVRFYKFDIRYFKEMLHQYLESVDSCFYIQSIDAIHQRNYGLSIYQELKTKKGLQVLISDRRVAHVLWEHKHIMCERIRYLISENYLPKDSEDIYNYMLEVKQLVYDLKYILLKYQIRPDRINEELIQERIDEICNKETVCLQNLYDRIVL